MPFCIADEFLSFFFFGVSIRKLLVLLTGLSGLSSSPNRKVIFIKTCARLGIARRPLAEDDDLRDLA